MLRTLISSLGSEEGTVKDMVWVIGAAVVTGLVLIAAMIFVPDTVRGLWADLTNWLKNELKI